MDSAQGEMDLLCEGCGYSLVGLEGDTCPECGRRYDPAQLPLARVPWLHRSRLGSIRAYRRTWIMILRDPGTFARELGRPVRISQDDAKRFRARTINRAVIEMLGLGLVLAAAGMVIEYQKFTSPPVFHLVHVAVRLVVVFILAAVALWIFLKLATDLPTFIWRGLPRAPRDLGPLHFYACAPLALLPWITILALAALGLGILLMGKGVISELTLRYSLIVLIGAMVSYPIFSLVRIPVSMMHSAAPCTRRRRLALAAYLPFHWIVMLVLCAMIFFIGLAITMPVLDAAFSSR